MKKIGLLLFCIASLAACSEKKNEIEKISHPIDLKSENLKTDSLLRGHNTFVDCYKDFLILRSGFNSAFYLCGLYDDSLKLELEFGEIGDGPSQFAHPVAFFSKDTNKLILKSSDNDKIFVFSEPFAENIKNEKKELFDVKNTGNCVWTTTHTTEMINDSTMISVGGNPESDEVFTLLSKGQAVLPVMSFPYPVLDDELEPVFRRMLYLSSFIAKQPNHNKYAWVGAEGNYMSLFSLEGNQAVDVCHVLTDYPNCTQTETGLNSSPDDAMGYTVQVTEKYIYLCKTPFETRQEWYDVLENKGGILPNGYPHYYSDVICVYDWEGNHVRDYKLDSPIKSFVVTSTDDKIIGQSLDINTDEERMVLFRLGN